MESSSENSFVNTGHFCYIIKCRIQNTDGRTVWNKDCKIVTSHFVLVQVEIEKKGNICNEVTKWNHYAYYTMHAPYKTCMHAENKSTIYGDTTNRLDIIGLYSTVLRADTFVLQTKKIFSLQVRLTTFLSTSLFWFLFHVIDSIFFL